MLNIRLRGNRFSMPAGYVMGRSKGGKGPPQLIKITDLTANPAQATGGASGGAAVVVPPYPLSMDANPGDDLPLFAQAIIQAGTNITVTRQGRRWTISATVPASNLPYPLSMDANPGDSLPFNGQTVLLAGSNITITRQGRRWTISGTGGGGGSTISNQGAWNSSSAYSVGMCVTYNGCAYLCYNAVSASTSVAAAWNPATLGAHMSLSTTVTSNDTATTSSGGTSDQFVESLTDGKSTGAWYYEMGISGWFDNGTQFGAATAAEIPGLSDKLINCEFAGPIASNFSGGGSGTVTALINNKRAGFAMNITGNAFWFTPDVTASPIAWNNSTSNAPNGSGGVAIGTVSAAVFKWFYGQGHTGQVAQLFSRPGDLLIPTVPSGYSPWVLSSGSPNTAPDIDFNHWVGVSQPIDVAGNMFAHDRLGGV